LSASQPGTIKVCQRLTPGRELNICRPLPHWVLRKKIHGRRGYGKKPFPAGPPLAIAPSNKRRDPLFSMTSISDPEVLAARPRYCRHTTAKSASLLKTPWRPGPLHSEQQVLEEQVLQRGGASVPKDGC